MTQLRFDGRVAVVTGAGGGLGREYALALASRGCKVVVNDLAGDPSAPSAADKVVGEITSTGGEAVANDDSVACRQGGSAIVECALDTFGRLDILISNAGILRTARFDEMTDDDIDSVIDVHLKGAFYVGQPAFAAMKRQRYGRLLFTSSSSGMFGHPWQASYGAAKAGIVGLSNVVALEGKDFGVLSNAIMPNARTNMADEVDFSWAQEVSEVGATLRKLMALGGGDTERLHPRWVVPLAIKLVSEQSSETHQIYTAIGGRYSRVFVGATAGWTAPELASAEDIAGHWEQIRGQQSQFYEPLSVYDEALLTRELAVEDK